MQVSKGRRPQYQVRKYLDSRTGMWYLRYRSNGRKITETAGVRDKVLAEKIRKEKENELVLARFGFTQLVLDALSDPHRQRPVLEAAQAKDPVPLSQAVEEYVKHAKTNLTPNWAYTTERTLRKFLAAMPEEISVGQVTTKQVQDYLDGLEQNGASTKTRRNVKGVLVAFFSYCIKIAGYLPANPASGTRLPKVKQEDIEYLEPEEVVAVLEKAEGDSIQTLIACAIYSGIRRGELARLQWDNVDLKALTLRIVDTKTGTNRTVPIHSSLFPLLASLPRFGGGYVFQAPKGGSWATQMHKLSKRVRLMMKRAGLDGYGLLECRHTFATALAQAGVSLDEISELMGNSPEIVKKHYARFRPDKMHDRVEKGFKGFFSKADEEGQAAAE